MEPIKRLLCVALLAGLSASVGCEPGKPDVQVTPPEAATPADSPAAPETEREVSAEDVEREAREAFDATSQYAKQQAAELHRKLQQQIDELDPEIEKLKAQGKDLTEQAKPEWNRRMVQLEEKRQAAQRKLDAWKKASPDAWQALQSGASEAWTDLKQSYDDAASHFRKAESSQRDDAEHGAPAKD